MTLERTSVLVAEAANSGEAVLAFNVISLEHAEGIVAGLASAGANGILQLSENLVRFRDGAVAPITAACRELAERADARVSIHLDHVQDPELARAGIRAASRLGISSIMIDAAHLAYADNVRTTAELTRRAHSAGLWVEAELGEIGGKDGAHAPGARTDPDEAAAFVAATGVDGLAVAVGSSHAMTTATADLDQGLVSRIARAVPIPLVLHGSSGVPPRAIAEAATHGIRKINVGTALNVGFTQSVRDVLASDEALTDPRRYLAPAREAVAATVRSLIETTHRPNDAALA